MKYHVRTMSQSKGWLLALVLMSLAIVSTAPNTTGAQDTPVTQSTVTQADDPTDMVLVWNAHAANAIVGVAGQRPERGLIRLAMVHIAIYDAVNAINHYPFEFYATMPAVVSPASVEAATAAAAHEVLLALFPRQQPDLDEVRVITWWDSLMVRKDERNFGRTTNWRRYLCLGAPTTDRTLLRTPGSGPGVWMPTPPAFLPAAAPETALVQPFALINPSQFRAAPPPELTSKTWTRDFNEVKRLGAANGSSRTPEQTDIGRFWSDQPILQWNRAWRSISINQRLSLSDNARFFAILAVAAADVIIACWDSKYTYNFWRPVTAIRAADADGNPATEPDPNWIGQVITPNHPEYPAGHGCFSGASVHTLKAFFGTDSFTFTIDSSIPGLTSPVRSYNTFSQALDEVCDARVFGGMHYRNSTLKGAKIGKHVANYVTRHFFRPSKQ
jgi:hypothetical protein